MKTTRFSKLLTMSLVATLAVFLAAASAFG